MMTTPPTSSYKPPPSSSKRHSLSISTGPRPLHLVDGNVPSAPSTAPLASRLSYPNSPISASPRSGDPHRPKAARRQSSISYNPRDSPSRSPLGGTPTSTRRHSLGPRALQSPGPKGHDRRSLGASVNEPPSTVERPPLTLAEKHAELLQFIAQKESKCLELRSQLATHEAELLQLKQKWERIVNHGFVRGGAGGNGPLSPPGPGQAGGAMLGGIKEGVQGVSRLLAAGLNMGDQHSPAFPSPAPRPPRVAHSANASNSSSSTYTTKSTRFSQSSFSSIGEDLVAARCDTEADGSQVLMVRDTGATPTMSPNPDFLAQREHDKQAGCSRKENELEFGQFVGSAKMHRRKSRDIEGDGILSPRSTFRDDPSTLEESALEKSKRAKRASLNGSAFPPVSSIPGLGSLTVATTPLVSSWVGSVGKKWEELQRGSSFSKNQKRASTMLSDVSQSIATALSSPQTPGSAYSTPLSLSSACTTLSSGSLLDDDDDSTSVLSSVMTPDLKPKPLMEPMKPMKSTPLIPTPPNTKKPVKTQDEDEEWNW